MAGFYIKEVIANSSEKGDASVTFGKGLNIIRGRSDSGKTCVANCIDFIYGGNNKPFKGLTKYDGVTMVVASNDERGEVKLHRVIGKNKVDVVSTVSGIESGEYDTKYRKKAKNASLNDVWLRLMGIEPEIMIVKNSRFETRRLTWKNLLRIFFLDEGRVDDADSILIPKHDYVENTLFLSALLYLITGQTFNETDTQEKKEIKKARRKAVKDYVNQKIQDSADRKRKLEENLHILEGVDVETQIAEAMMALEETKKKIDYTLNESQKILSDIFDDERQIAECNVLLNRYQNLSSQYKSDIKRLSLISEGEKVYQNIQQPLMCPYCDNPINPRKRNSYLKSARITIKRIIADLSGLQETEKDVDDQKRKVQMDLVKLKKQRDDLESVIENQLRPQESQQLNIINSYKAYLRIKTEMNLIDSYAENFGNDLDDIENEQKNEKMNEYRPKEYFGDDFVSTMSEYAQVILKECNYSNLLKATFDATKFDIMVNGEDKETSHGKGYRSYLNTVMIMMIRKYLYNHAKFNPRTFIIDTPLHGFDDGVDDDMPESMRSGLYRYFINHQEEGQLIIIENLDHIPNLDYESNGATVTTFEKADGPGKRYGFLNDVR